MQTPRGQRTRSAPARLARSSTGDTAVRVTLACGHRFRGRKRAAGHQKSACSRCPLPRAAGNSLYWRGLPYGGEGRGRGGRGLVANGASGPREGSLGLRRFLHAESNSGCSSHVLLWTQRAPVETQQNPEPQARRGCPWEGAKCRMRRVSICVRSHSVGATGHTSRPGKAGPGVQRVTPGGSRLPQCLAGRRLRRDLHSVSGVGGAPSAAEETLWSHPGEKDCTQPPALGPGPSPLYPAGHSQGGHCEDRGGTCSPCAARPLPVDSKRRECGGALHCLG